MLTLKYICKKKRKDGGNGGAVEGLKPFIFVRLEVVGVNKLTFGD